MLKVYAYLIYPNSWRGNKSCPLHTQSAPLYVAVRRTTEFIKLVLWERLLYSCVQSYLGKLTYGSLRCSRTTILVSTPISKSMPLDKNGLRKLRHACNFSLWLVSHYTDKLPLWTYLQNIASKFTEQFGAVQTAELHQHCTTQASFAVTNNTTESTVVAAQCLIHSLFLLGVSLFSRTSDSCQEYLIVWFYSK